MSDSSDPPEPDPAGRAAGDEQPEYPEDDAGQDAEEDGGSPLDFDPVLRRFRFDGWTPERQEDFIRALAESGCVAESARRVGKSVTSAYELRALPEAQSFRLAWDAALDMAMPRMSDAAISRCIHGVPVPHFYKGEKVGEHRRYDERLTMWMLRYRDPVRYGKYLDRLSYRRHADGAAIALMHRIAEMWDSAFGCLKRRWSEVGPLDVDEFPR